MDIKDLLKIADDFRKYLDSEDRKIIIKYSKKELLKALNNITTGDRNFPWYKAIERRIEEIDREKEKWSNRIIGFVLGIALALLISYLKGCIGMEEIKT